jgi:hypothetical protein
MYVTPRFCRTATFLAFSASALNAFAADWKATPGSHPDLAGQSVIVTQDGKLVALRIW